MWWQWCDNHLISLKLKRNGTFEIFMRDTMWKVVWSSNRCWIVSNIRYLPYPTLRFKCYNVPYICIHDFWKIFVAWFWSKMTFLRFSTQLQIICILILKDFWTTFLELHHSRGSENGENSRKFVTNSTVFRPFWAFLQCLL